MFVTTTLESLQRQLGSTLGSLEGGYLIGKEAVRRIACDANIIPVVLGSAGQPLDIGRSTRIVPQGLRRALILRDGGCGFPGCDRPPSGATPTTSTTGPTAGPPRCATSRCFAFTTTTGSTKTAGPSKSSTAFRGSSPQRGSTPNNDPDYTAAIAYANSTPKAKYWSCVAKCALAYERIGVPVDDRA